MKSFGGVNLDVAALADIDYALHLFLQKFEDISKSHPERPKKYIYVTRSSEPNKEKIYRRDNKQFDNKNKLINMAAMNVEILDLFAPGDKAF